MARSWVRRRAGAPRRRGGERPGEVDPAGRPVDPQRLPEPAGVGRDLDGEIVVAGQPDLGPARKPLWNSSDRTLPGASLLRV